MRKILLFLIVITTSGIFILRLFYLQVYNSEPYSIYEDNAIRKVFNGPIISEIYPNIILLNTAQNNIIDKIFPPVIMLKP